MKLITDKFPDFRDILKLLLGSICVKCRKENMSLTMLSLYDFIYTWVNFKLFKESILIEVYNQFQDTTKFALV